MKTDTYARITTLCAALAAASALAFDRFEALRVPVALIGVVAATVAVVTYFRARVAAAQGVPAEGVAPVAVLHDRPKQRGLAESQASWRPWYAFDRLIDTSRTFDASDEMSLELPAQAWVLFEPTTKGRTPFFIGAVPETARVGIREFFVTKDGLLAVRQLVSHKQRFMTGWPELGEAVADWHSVKHVGGELARIPLRRRALIA